MGLGLLSVSFAFLMTGAFPICLIEVVIKKKQVHRFRNRSVGYSFLAVC